MTREEMINSPEYKEESGYINGYADGCKDTLQDLWLDAQGDVLPEIDREVIVLCDFGFGGYKVCFGHRPNPKGWNGRSISTGMVDHYTPQTYDKGEWNIPNVRWWLDVELPNMEDEQ